MFAQLFFDFPDRRDNELFIARVLNPTLAIGFKPNLNDPQQRATFLLNLGYSQGANAVLQAVGVVTRKQTSEAELLRNATTELLASASMKAKCGDLAVESPEFGLLETLLRGQAEQQGNS